MSSAQFDDAKAAYAAVAAALDRADALSLDGLSHEERLKLLEVRQRWRRRLPAGEHALVNEVNSATREELGGAPAHVLADRLRIRRGEARQRIAEAADLGPRRTLTGQPLPPKLEATAARQRDGLIDAEHLKVIRMFFAQLPSFIDEPTRTKAERDLASVAATYRPDQLHRYAVRYALVLNPDGTFSDQDRARRRGITVGPQGFDGMSRISGYLSPEARAGWDAVAAKWAAPGMCNPADEEPTVSTAASSEAINADVRTTAQRNHDAFNAMLRSTLTSGELGSHKGLPVTIVATVELAHLQAKAGVAKTGGGTLLPVKDVIRMAAQSYNYLLIFDNAKRCELYKGRTTRLATPAQRLVLYATERGCTRPGCDVPPYWCEVHHATKRWASGGQSNIDEETLACGPDNRLVEDGGWTTRKNDKGETEWIPPPHLDRGQPRTNTNFRPERMLPDVEDDADAPDDVA
ncbi:MAG TPA: HNH endonuclease signature motif containing protein [Mycobacterium sp.]|nr:HNH endonuclease signature motif containing protein [Mycobacterium sp.]